jgi:hypothetical protein
MSLLDSCCIPVVCVACSAYVHHGALVCSYHYSFALQHALVHHCKVAVAAVCVVS